MLTRSENDERIVTMHDVLDVGGRTATSNGRIWRLSASLPMKGPANASTPTDNADRSAERERPILLEANGMGLSRAQFIHGQESRFVQCWQ